MKPRAMAVAVLVLASALCSVRGQEKAADDKYVTKDDYQKLKAEHEKVQRELEALKTQLQDLLKNNNASAVTSKVQELEKKSATQQSETDQAISDLEKELKTVKQMAKDSFPGTTKMLLAGYGSATYLASRGGYGPSQPPEDTTFPPREGHSLFTATFNPIFLWKMSDRLLFEGELELELEGHDTSTALEMAQLSYLVNDYITIGAGKFLNPVDYFVERQHMAWVNKLPDKPLAVYDGLLPESLLGVQVRGAIPAGPTKFGYAFFVANGPTLRTSADDPANPFEVGTLDFEDFDNSFDHRAVGGRVGFYPIPELEVGYGLQYSGVGPRGTGIDALTHSADLTYVRESEKLLGTVNLHAQWVWSHVDHFTYDADGSLGFGPLDFSNSRDGGYAQLAYRPTKLENNIIKNVEPVLRYDVINQKKTPIGFDERRWTVGLNYWLGPSAVVKAAYEWDHQNGAGESGEALLLQFAVGF